MIYKMRKYVFISGTAVLFLIMSFACRQAPVSICPDNPHYFSYKGKPLVLITSDHHYGAVIDRDFDYEKFLTYLSANGMNLTRIYPGGMFETPDKYLKGNPLGPLPGRQLLPWAKSDQAGADSTLAEAGKPSYKYDLDKWNPEYFNRLKAFVSSAREKDIIVEVPFFNGMYAVCWPRMAMYSKNNIQNVGNYDAVECGLFTTNDARNQDVIKYQVEYIKKITRELNEFENVIFDICDEPSLQGLPDGSCIFMPDSVITPWINRMKDAYSEAELKLPNKHILGQTVQNLSPDFSKESWCDWLPAEYVKTGEKALLLNYKNSKPIVNVESNYFGCTLTKNPYTADAVRVEGWSFMLGGGAGCINLNGEYYRGQETGGSITQNEIVPQKKVLINFINSLDFVKMSRFSNFSGTPPLAFCSALYENGKQYALYLFHGAYESEWGSHFMPEPGTYRDTLTLDSFPAGTYLKDWIAPISGTVTNSESFEWNGGNLEMITPSYTVDIALRIIKIE
jgi:hypothetical protein